MKLLILQPLLIHMTMKTKEEIRQITDFIATYSTYLLASGVHTSRALRNAERIGKSQGVTVRLTYSLRNIVVSITEPESDETVTKVIGVPILPISFERNSDLSTLSWKAVDENMTLEQIKAEYEKLISKPKMDPIFVLIMASLANASFCRLFGGDFIACCIVFTSTLVGFSVRQRMQAHKINHYLVFISSSFIASLCAAMSLNFDCTSEIALATSPLFLVPGVPLINGVIDIMEGHVLTGCSRLINALLLIICIAIGLAATLTMIKDSLL